ncbi:MAG: hypothetical protein H7A37_08160 [Chlamydiales bacterium]|nr:hypothetical protein [Chlamydiia bacterium]MCP5508252.1 hypothetical protein [Chlamydiales bacterium]
MKKAFLLTAILYTGALFANSNCVGYEAHFDVLFLQPNSSNLYYGAEADPLPVPTPNWKSLEIYPNFHFGFELGGTVHCQSTNTAICLNWERLHSHDTSSRSVPDTDMLGPYFNIGPDAEPYKNATGRVDHEFDEVNVNFKRAILCECNFEMNYFGGVVFTRIKQSMTSYFSNNAGTITKEIQSPSLFTGGGIDFGVDFDYCLGCNFSLTGETSLSLLYGQLTNSTLYLSTTPLLAGLGITPPNTQGTTVPNRTQVVPAISGKLGVSYETCCSSYLVNVGFGYQVQAYIDAIQSVDMSCEVTTPPEDTQVGVYALGFRRTLSNFLLSGPYITLDVGF